MITAPAYNKYNYFIVKEEWHIGDPIPNNVKKVMIVQYKSLQEDGNVSYYNVPVFIYNDAENVLSETEILQVVDGLYATTASRLGQIFL